MRLILSLFLIFMISGCSLFRWGDGDGVSATALPFKASLAKGDDRRDIIISVRGGRNGVEAVRETVRFTATRYCLPTFGGSDVAWAINPATQDWSFVRNGEDMIFSGRCTAR